MGAICRLILLCGLACVFTQGAAHAQEQKQHLFEIRPAETRCVLSIGLATPEMRARTYILNDMINFLSAGSGGEKEREVSEIPDPFRFFVLDRTDQKHLEWLGWLDQLEPTIVEGWEKKRFLIRLNLEGVDDNLGPMFGLTSGARPLDGHMMFSILETDYEKHLSDHSPCEESSPLMIDRFRMKYERAREESRRFIEEFREDQKQGR